ncbi:hypothetical protein MMC28_009589 [Mycoblastus sanguinarius]|nr:hypothetical protein [Mycoblastus sanguinarius]
MSLAPCCSLCGSPKNLSRCAVCKVTSYCNQDHQVADRKRHARECKAVKNFMSHVEREEQLTLADLFETSVGRFWAISENRDLLPARYMLVEALLEIKTFEAVECAADHLHGMLRLSCSDKLGVRHLLPAILLRLGRDQQCYDFVKWWANNDPDGNLYGLGDPSLPFLDVVDANVFESPQYLCVDFPDLSHIVSVTLLKIKLLLDLKVLQNSAFLVKKLPQELLEMVRRYIVASKIIWKDGNIMSLVNLADIIQKLSLQVDTLFKAVGKANKHFWTALINPAAHLNKQRTLYDPGSIWEMESHLQYCFDSWNETPGAIDIIKSKIGNQAYHSELDTLHRVMQ